MSQPLNTISEPRNETLLAAVVLIDEYSLVFQIKDGKTYAVNRPKNDTWLDEKVSNGDALVIQFTEYQSTYKGIPKKMVKLELCENLSETLGDYDPEPPSSYRDRGMEEFYDAGLDSGMGTYLSDGMYIRADGSIYDSKG